MFKQFSLLLAIVLGASFAFAFHIIVLARYSPAYSPAGLTVVQVWFAAAAAAIFSLTTENTVAPTHPDVVWGTIITGLFASALGYFIQTLAQRYVSPTRTAVILVTEPAFAGLFGIVLLGEALSVRGWIGAGLILTSSTPVIDSIMASLARLRVLGTGPVGSRSLGGSW